MKNKKGVTLLDVIVAIVILGIAIVSTIQIMATNNKLVIKNERGINSIQEIESIMEVFSSNPEQFKQNISSIYGVEENDVIKAIRKLADAGKVGLTPDGRITLRND